jgi:nucleoside-triphosphatase THEP1
MVLVAVTGPVGSGKTTVLSSLSSWTKEQGKSVDGFLALSHDRVEAGKGAEEYVLQLIASGTQHPFVKRDTSLTPPYRIDFGTMSELAAWAGSLKLQHPLSVLILDEFGPLEARGDGHMKYWESVQAAKPEVVIIAVREKVMREVEAKLGSPFDVVFDVTQPDVLENLQNLVLHHSDWVRVGQFGAAAGGFEATVGSALHQAKVPMSGLFLSVVQSLVMMYAGDRLANRGRVMWVPVISAGLKALSPYGGRLRPMLAITVQGFLFSLAATVFGWNVVGILVGGWFVGAWAALQGLVLQYLFIGDNLLPALDVIVKWAAEHLHVQLPGIVSIIALWTVVCGTVSSLATLFAWLRRHRLPARIRTMLEKGSRGIIGDVGTPSIKAAIRKGLRDLLRPMFWAPVVFVGIIILANGSTWEQAMWVVLRAVTVGWVLFSVARLFDPRKLVSWLRRKGHWGPAMALSRALRSEPESHVDKDQTRP